MKYKRGSMVELLTADEVPYHSWRCAQIVSGNGHNYAVRYDVYPDSTNKGEVERVSRKFIRPCPPSVEISEFWRADVVEVFHNRFWRMAIVSEALGWDWFLVRLVGSFQEFEARISDLRVRQSWQNDKWTVIGKVPINNEDGQHSKLLKHNPNAGSQDNKRDAKRNIHMKGLCAAAQNNSDLQEAHIFSGRALKRGSPCFSQDVMDERTAHKFRQVQKEGRRLRVLVTSPEKVDAVPNSREMLCEKGIYSSFDNRATRFYAAKVETENPSGAYGCSRALSLEPNDADSITCSVGSCSINSYKPYEMQWKSGDGEDIEGYDSDAESVCQVDYQEDLSLPNKELVAEIRRLELHAYRCTMEALHASGPLSWEKETMAPK